MANAKTYIPECSHCATTTKTRLRPKKKKRSTSVAKSTPHQAVMSPQATTNSRPTGQTLELRVAKNSASLVEGGVELAEGTTTDADGARVLRTAPAPPATGAAPAIFVPWDNVSWEYLSEADVKWDAHLERRFPV